MLIQLPVETWIEILDWLKRRDLIKKLDKLWDHEFTPIMQDWLHKYTRNVKLGRLLAYDDGLKSVRSCGQMESVPFADVDMPENVASFERITIKYLDSNALAFLRRLRPLFHNNCLKIDYYDDGLSTRTALRFLMPIINNGSLESMGFDYKLLQFFSTNQPSALLNAKSLRISGFLNSDTISVELVNWLFTRRGDGQPRTLLLSSICPYPAGYWEKLQERFLDPTRQSASPFFIRLLPNDYQDLADILPNIPDTENVRTGEQLDVSPSGLIRNCPIKVDPEWVAKKEGEVFECCIFDQQKVIWLIFPQLGQIDDDQNAEEAI